jgi:hypothetical protein
MDDLAVEYRVCGLQLQRQALAQFLKRFVDVPLAGDQARSSSFHVGDGPEAVVFYFEDPVGMFEGLVPPDERHGLDGYLSRHIPV